MKGPMNKFAPYREIPSFYQIVINNVPRVEHRTQVNILSLEQKLFSEYADTYKKQIEKLKTKIDTALSM